MAEEKPIEVDNDDNFLRLIIYWLAEDNVHLHKAFTPGREDHKVSGDIESLVTNLDESRNRVTSWPTAHDPEDFYVAILNVGEIRQLNPLDVKHEPKEQNPAHSGIVNWPPPNEVVAIINLQKSLANQIIRFYPEINNFNQHH